MQSIILLLSSFLFCFNLLAANTGLSIEKKCSKSVDSPFYQRLEQTETLPYSSRWKEVIAINRVFFEKSISKLDRIQSDVESIAQALEQKANSRLGDLPKLRTYISWIKTTKEALEYLSGNFSRDFENVLKEKQDEQTDIKSIQLVHFFTSKYAINVAEIIGRKLDLSEDGFFILYSDSKLYVSKEMSEIYLKQLKNLNQSIENPFGQELTLVSPVAYTSEKLNITSYRSVLKAVSQWRSPIFVAPDLIAVHKLKDRFPDDYSEHDYFHMIDVARHLRDSLFKEFGLNWADPTNLETARARSQKLGQHLIQKFDAHPNSERLYLLAHYFFFEFSALYSKDKTLKLLNDSISYLKKPKDDKKNHMQHFSQALLEAQAFGTEKDRSDFRQGKLDLSEILHQMLEIVEAFEE